MQNFWQISWAIARTSATMLLVVVFPFPFIVRPRPTPIPVRARPPGAPLHERGRRRLTSGASRRCPTYR
ncbi:MAG: hypothetical protein JSS02_28235 [Planctomycetes bacterium]|nr:hypothetical protein [Planctomycetota bacterium]